MLQNLPQKEITKVLYRPMGGWLVWVQSGDVEVTFGLALHNARIQTKKRSKENWCHIRKVKHFQISDFRGALETKP